MSTKAQRRRYALHKHIRKFTTTDVDTRQVNITQHLYDTITPKQRAWVDELRDKFGYNIQLALV